MNATRTAFLIAFASVAGSACTSPPWSNRTASANDT
jgi:hypothetical protein